MQLALDFLVKRVQFLVRSRSGSFIGVSPDGASADTEKQGRRTVPAMDLRHRDGGDTVGESEEDLARRTRRVVAGDDAAATVTADAAVDGRLDTPLFSDQLRAARESARP